MHYFPQFPQRLSCRSSHPSWGRLCLIVSCAALLPLLFAPIALADYQPPSDAAPPRTPSSGLGTRGGCSSNASSSLQVLAPQDYAGQTISTHPTFAWQVPDAEPIAMEFHLYRYQADIGSERQLVQKVISQSQPGLNQWTLPPTEPGLTSGQYHWQVVLLCDPNHPSSAIVAGADLQVVQRPGLEDSLTTADRLTRANRFVDERLWYDALRETLSPDPDASLQRVQEQLLEQVFHHNQFPIKTNGAQ